MSVEQDIHLSSCCNCFLDERLALLKVVCHARGGANLAYCLAEASVYHLCRTVKYSRCIGHLQIV